MLAAPAAARIAVACHQQTLTCCHADAMLAQRGEVAISSDELHELRTLAANGADSAELAQETADLIALLHQARSSNATVSPVSVEHSRSIPIAHQSATCIVTHHLPTWHMP